MSVIQHNQPINAACKETATVAIIGAGASGIVCARELRKRGWKRVQLFEASHRAGGKTCSLVMPHPVNEKPEVIELGTTTILNGPVLDEILQETGLDKELRNLPRVKVRNPPETNDYHPIFIRTPEPMPWLKKLWEMLRFVQAIGRLDCLDQPGFKGASGQGVAMSIEEWFNQQQLVLPKYLAMPVISSGLCGVAYDRVPAAYMIKIYKTMLRVPAWRNALTLFRTVKPGNDEIWHRAATMFDIHYNQPVQKIQLTNGKVSIATNKGNYQVDRLIWTGGLPALDKVITYPQGATAAIAPSRKHYRNVNYLKRGVFTYRFKGLPRNNSWIHTDSIMQKKYGIPLACANVKNTDWYYFYPWFTPEHTLDDVDRAIRDFAVQLGGKVIDRVAEPAIWQYNPYFSGDDIEQGVFDVIENDQGKDGIYVCGETLSGITLPSVTEYAKDLVERHF